MTRILDWVNSNSPSNSVKRLTYSAILAFLVEATLLTAIGWHEHWLAHPQKSTGQDESQFIEAQVYQVPSQARLVDEKKIPVHREKKETALSKIPNKGIPSSKPTSIEEENRTESGPKIVPNHGPVAVYAPAPSIPSYLQNKEFKSNVVIDFYVNSQGQAIPHLVGSSGDEELDALALETAKKWQFRPAEENNKSIDSKVRLRIIFKVE